MFMNAIQHLNPMRRDLFLPCHEEQVVKLIEDSAPLVNDVAYLITKYLTSRDDCFGVKEFMRYWGAFPLGFRPLPFEEFYEFWHGPDPIDPTQQRCETHYFPCLSPQRVLIGGREYLYTFRTLSYLIYYAREGRRCATSHNELFHYLLERGNPAVEWVVARHPVAADAIEVTKKSYWDQRMSLITMDGGYDRHTYALPLATLSAAEYIKTGNGIAFGATNDRALDSKRDLHHVCVSIFAHHLRFDGEPGTYRLVNLLRTF
jgi:hypothetical protein